MKTKSIFVSVLFLSLFLVLFTGCKKNSFEKQNQMTLQISQDDLKISDLIESFKLNGKSQLKDDERMPLDSAIWFLEATANYTYGDGSQEIERTATDSTFISFEVDNDSVLLSEVYNTYEQMIDSIREYYHSLSDSTRQLITVSVEPYSLSGSELTCKAVYTFAVGNYPVAPCDFNDIDGWKPFGAQWNSGGICSGPNTGQQTDKDLATEIQSKVMRCKAVPVGNVWYDHLTDFVIDGRYWPDPNYSGGSQGTNYTSHYVYYNNEEFPGYQDCVPPNDCQYYLIGTKYVLYTSENASNPGLRPDGYNFILLYDFRGELIPSTPYGVMTHRGYARYGILHISPYEPDSLD